MMLLDANGWLGHYPFRAVTDPTPDGLLRRMDRCGIERAVVSSLHCVFYTDAHRGNEELARWVHRHRDRLVPCATLNPAFPGWERDLRECCESWNMRGLRLFPSHHRYALTSAPCRELVQAASERPDDAEAQLLAALAAAAVGWDGAAQDALARIEYAPEPLDADLLADAEEAIDGGAEPARTLLLETIGPPALHERLAQPL